MTLSGFSEHAGNDPAKLSGSIDMVAMGNGGRHSPPSHQVGDKERGSDVYMSTLRALPETKPLFQQSLEGKESQKEPGYCPVM